MKKGFMQVVALILSLVCLMSLASCGVEEPHRRQPSVPEQTETQQITKPARNTIPTLPKKPTQRVTEPVEDPTEPETEPEPEMTVDEFTTKTQGIWIMDSSIQLMGGDSFCFAALCIGDHYLTSAYYPGEYGAQGNITNIETVGDNVYELTLYYEPGTSQISTETVRVTLVSSRTIIVKYSRGQECYLTYGGTSFEDAHVIAGRVFQQHL